MCDSFHYKLKLATTEEEAEMLKAEKKAQHLRLFKKFTLIKKNYSKAAKKGSLLSTFSVVCIIRLPRRKSAVDPQLVGEAFIERLENHNIGAATAVKLTKKKKFNVSAGQGITPDDLLPCGDEELEDDPESVPPIVQPKRGRGRPRKCPASFGSSSDSDYLCDDSRFVESFSSLEEEQTRSHLSGIVVLAYTRTITTLVTLSLWVTPLPWCSILIKFLQ